VSSWEQCLADDPDKHFILDGIKHGFSLIDPNININDIAPAHVQNSSCTSSPHVKPLVESAISEEIISGGYIHCTNKPKIISALSAVPKPDGDIRLIHDLSRPANVSVNSYASKDPCKYQSISDVLDIIQPNRYMAVVDLNSAYRSVNIKESERCLTGLSWCFDGLHEPAILCDTRLPFGARKSPAIFNRITQAVTRYLRKQGHHVVVYLDDFFVCGPDFASCKATFDALVQLLRRLGFQINWRKIVDPCQQLTFLGILIDTVRGTLSLKPAKVTELVDLLRSYQQRKRASRKQLESLAGKLSWAAHVTPCGRAHIQPVFTLISSLKLPSHKCRLGPIKPDLSWWSYWLTSGLNRRPIWPPSTPLNVYTDSCADAGGAFCHGYWLYAHWARDVPRLAPHHINVKELAAVILAAQTWRHAWAHHHVVVHTDNRVTEALINKGAARNITCLYLLRHLASLAILNNFTISASYIPGNDNIIADAISRLHEPGKLLTLCNILNVTPTQCLTLGDISLKTQHYLFQTLR
jgi:hypothetical protein